MKQENSVNVVKSFNDFQKAFFPIKKYLMLRWHFVIHQNLKSPMFDVKLTIIY
jgi:hypothetical protein